MKRTKISEAIYRLEADKGCYIYDPFNKEEVQSVYVEQNMLRYYYEFDYRDKIKSDGTESNKN